MNLKDSQFTDNSCVQSAYRHTFADFSHQNVEKMRPDPSSMNQDQPLDFSLKKKPRTEPAPAPGVLPRAQGAPNWGLQPNDNQLLRSCLERGTSAFHEVPSTNPGLPFSPFLANLLRSTSVNGRDEGAPPPKTVRPFKAYNPTDPTSALNMAGQYLGLTILPRAGRHPFFQSTFCPEPAGCRFVNQSAISKCAPYPQISICPPVTT